MGGIGIGIENFQETGIVIGIGIDISIERNSPIPFSIPPIHTSQHVLLHHSHIDDCMFAAVFRHLLAILRMYGL